MLVRTSRWIIDAAQIRTDVTDQCTIAVTQTAVFAIAFRLQMMMCLIVGSVNIHILNHWRWIHYGIDHISTTTRTSFRQTHGWRWWLAWIVRWNRQFFKRFWKSINDNNRMWVKVETGKLNGSILWLPLSVFGSEKYNEMMWWDRSTIFKNFFESIGAALLMATNAFDLWLTCVRFAEGGGNAWNRLVVHKKEKKKTWKLH